MIKMRKNSDNLDAFSSQKKRKISDNLNSYPQHLTQSHNLIRMILSCTLPLSIVNNNEFSQFCSSLDSRFILLNSETIRNTIINAYNRTNRLIQNKIIETVDDFKLIDVVLDVINLSGTHAATELFEKF
ncbi:28541_t:CDS:2 [Racocetra persica]|uniref:28541_t:CDS:1 n=1 Tax=Racocetra persica TaxID=160502 RepID=A0ACA9QRR4_9GLOM|nr:28541_t:CDS:2 [Racocetra persica]